MRRILFIAEAVTLAHVARMAALAASLPGDRFTVRLAVDPRYDGLLGDHPVERVPIPCIPAARFRQALETGSPIYDLATLRGYVAEDRRVIADFRPDVVVGDFRLSLLVSARLAGIPSVSVTNAYWSPYARLRIPVPDLPLSRTLGPWLAQLLFDIGRPFAFAAHAAIPNRLLREHGLPAMPRDVRHPYIEADRVCFADLPGLVDAPGAPGHHRTIGPVPWAPPLPDPAWWGELPDDRPIVYVNLGSSGLSSLLPAVSEALAALPVASVIATAGALVLPARPGLWQAPFLNGESACRRSRLVVSNGGSPTGYQALTAGCRLVGVPANLDQHLNSEVLRRAGLGVTVRSDRCTAGRLRAAVEAQLADAAGDARAAAARARIAACDWAANFRAVIDDLR